MLSARQRGKDGVADIQGIEKGREDLFYLTLVACGENSAALGEDGQQVGGAGLVGRVDELALGYFYVGFGVGQDLGPQPAGVGAVPL